MRWLGWSRLTDLAQLQNLNYAEKRQERNFVRFSAIGPHPYENIYAAFGPRGRMLKAAAGLTRGFY